MVLDRLGLWREGLLDNRSKPVTHQACAWRHTRMSAVQRRL